MRYYAATVAGSLAVAAGCSDACAPVRSDATTATLPPMPPPSDVEVGDIRLALHLSGRPARWFWSTSKNRAAPGVVITLEILNRTEQDLNAFLPPDMYGEEYGEPSPGVFWRLTVYPWKLLAHPPEGGASVEFDPMYHSYPHGSGPHNFSGVDGPVSFQFQTIPAEGSLRRAFFIHADRLRHELRRAGARSPDRPMRVQLELDERLLWEWDEERLRNKERWHEGAGNVIGRSNVLEVWLDAEDRMVMSLEAGDDAAGG